MFLIVIRSLIALLALRRQNGMWPTAWELLRELLTDYRPR
jgi:hypothetical protein